MVFSASLFSSTESGITGSVPILDDRVPLDALLYPLTDPCLE